MSAHETSVTPCLQRYKHTHTHKKRYTKVEQVAGTEHRWGHGDDSVSVLSPSE